ncbi:hypothetical protein ACPUEN_05855 [Algoriphagus yeomjeoni]|uniref:hypothetical protein n=1 Tax=Algoriphagus yeomjeoni TaxID=291403 RepID=UPI003CE4CD77
MKRLLGFVLIGLMSMTLKSEAPIKGSIEGYGKLPEMKLVLFTLGLDYPIELGTVAKKGEFTMDLSQALLPEEMPIEDMALFFGDLNTAFDGPFSNDDFGLVADFLALQNRYISIMDAKNRWAGNVFPVTSEELKNWLEDDAYNNAIPGSYLNIVYLEQPVTLDFPLTTQMPYQDQEIPVEYQFSLSLEPGFNWVQYDIEEVFVTDPKIRANFPSKITIRNLDDPSQFRWIGKYF